MYHSLLIKIYLLVYSSFMCVSNHLGANKGHRVWTIVWLLSVRCSYSLIKGSHLRCILISITVFMSILYKLLSHVMANWEH